MTTTIEPCPFCKSTNVVFVKKHVMPEGYYGEIKCLDCRGCTGINRHDIVKKQWNAARSPVYVDMSKDTFEPMKHFNGWE